MKEIKILVFLALFFLASSACVNEVALEEGTDGFIKTVKVVGPSEIQFEPITGGVSTKGTSVQDGSALLFNWAMGDTLGIFPNQGNQVEFPISSAQGGSSASFDGGGWALRNNADYAAYYPFSVWNYHRDNETILLDYSGQVQNGNGSFAHLSAYDFLASNKTTPQNSSVTFQMERQGSILYIDIVVPDPAEVNSLRVECDEAIFVAKATLDISGSNPVVTPVEMTNTLTLSFENTETTEANETVRAYLAVQPVDFSEKTVTATLTTDKVSYSAPVLSRVVNKGKAAFLRFADDFVPEYVPIPDENFRAYMIRNFDTNGNGVLDIDEAEAVTEISVNTDNITSVLGIEYCSNLTEIWLPGSRVWDSEKCFYVSKGQLSSLDVSSNPALTQLYCSDNQLTSLDVSANAALTYLSCSYNQLTSLDISLNTALANLICDHNQLTSLDVSTNTALTFLDCSRNQLKSLDLSSNAALYTLDCSYNQLASLDLSVNTALFSLNCSHNQLTSLDVSANTALTNLSCYSNQLTSLDVSANTALTYLSCYSNQLTSLDVSSNTALADLKCGQNQLTSLDVSANTALTILDCGSNPLTSLDVSSNTALTSLSCHHNQLNSLDLSANTALSSLECSSNQLTSLDISSNTALSILNCSYNQLTSLDVSKNTSLTHLYCSPMKRMGNNLLAYLYITQGQSIPGVTVDRNNQYVPDETIITLHCVPIPDENFRAYMIQNFDTNGNGVLDYDEAAAVTSINVNTDNIESMEGIAYCTNLQTLSCYGTRTLDSAGVRYIYNGKLTNLDVSFNTMLTSLTCYYNQLTTFDLSNNTVLRELHCYENQLTAIDVSANTALKILDCCGNKLVSLSVSGAATLEKLYCERNQMTSLDVSGAPALIYLGCNSNNLTSLNVGANTLLARLDCYNNQLTSLDLSNNSALTYLSCSNNMLTNLDLSANSDLTNLHCYKNQLTSLDLTANKSLLILSCYDNKLTSLDVSSAPFLSELDCSPMNDQSSNNMLATLYIADGQSIPKVTTDRNDSNVPAGTIVTSKPSSFMYSTPEAVDLGLSVKWASFNLGASSPEEYGHYYAWGETRPKARYTWENYQWSNGNYTSLTKYNTDSAYGDVDNKTVLDLEDDAAHVNLGSGWRMPNQSETYELQTECTWTWTTLGGRNGYRVTGPNGNSIFIPAAGMRYAQLCYDDGSNACYWSSSLDLEYYPSIAYRWDIIDGSFSPVVNCDRNTGRSVRPVFDSTP